MNTLDIPKCAHIASKSTLSDVYGFTEEAWITQLTAALKEEINILIVALEEETITGFAWAHPKGAFLTAPYLRFIAVNPHYQGKGIGAKLISEFEYQTRHIKRDFVLLVSSFNLGAQALYMRLGYKKVGELADFVVPGVTEYLMVKNWEKEGA